MKSFYIILGPTARDNSIADTFDGEVMGLPGVRWISRINVAESQRGDGVGSKLLQQILDDADAEGVTLALEVSSSGRLSNEILEQWYARRGFQFIELKIPRSEPPQTYPAWVRTPPAASQ